MSNKLHGNTGNQNARKYDNPEDAATLFVRCAQEDKNSWVKAAQAEGKKVGAWVIEQLNKASKL